MKTPYKISIITPFHNVEPEVFKRAYESMRNQTIGFENVEWIVVLHNCEARYKTYMQELLSKHKNVRIEILDNTVYTPASPRNYAFELAQGEFIGYLDADDGYTPACLERALYYIEKNDADIVSFRREYVANHHVEQVLNEIVLWNQTREEIVITPQTWNDKKIFCGIWGIVTSKLFRKSFLKEQNLAFDCDIPFAEGFAFCTVAYVHARKICLLPQFIGYIYFIRDNSLVQDTNKTPEELIAYAKGFKKLFDIGLKEGIYMNDIMTSLLYHMSWFISENSELTEEQLATIQAILEPYVLLLQKLPTSKLYSKQDVNLRYEFTRKTLLNSKASDKKRERTLATAGGSDITHDKQSVVLEELIEMGQNTDLGERFHFSSIFSIEDFQKRVPILDYAFYKPMIDLMTRVGERNIFMQEIPRTYILFNSYARDFFLLPCSDRLTMSFVTQLASVLEGQKSALLANSYGQPFTIQKKTYVNTRWGNTLWAYISSNLSSIDFSEQLASPLDVLFPKNHPELTYYQYFFSALKKDITQIVAPFAKDVLAFLDMLENNWEKFADDIERGQFLETDETAKRLNKNLAPHKDRADEIRHIFSTQKGPERFQSLWPNLVRIVAECAGPSEEDGKLLQRRMPHVQLKTLLFSVPEAPIAKTIFSGNEFVLNQDVAFYEFLPREKQTDQALLVDQLSEGCEYDLLISNYSGLYRYRSGVVVRFVTNKGQDALFSLVKA